MCFIKKVFLLKNFAMFTGKHLSWRNLFQIMVPGLKACKLIKKRPQHRCFPVNIAKFLRTPVLRNSCKRLLLYLDLRRREAVGLRGVVDSVTYIKFSFQKLHSKLHVFHKPAKVLDKGGSRGYYKIRFYGLVFLQLAIPIK